MKGRAGVRAEAGRRLYTHREARAIDQMHIVVKGLLALLPGGWAMGFWDHQPQSQQLKVSIPGNQGFQVLGLGVRSQPFPPSVLPPASQTTTGIPGLPHGLKESGPSPGKVEGWGLGAVKGSGTGGRDPPHLHQHRLLRCCRLVMDERQVRAADRDGHRWDTRCHHQWGPGRGWDRNLGQAWPGLCQDTASSQEWGCRGWDGTGAA